MECDSVWKVCVKGNVAVSQTCVKGNVNVCGRCA